MIFYGLLHRSLQEVVELFVSRVDAERTLLEVLHDEPQWESILGLLRVEFAYEEATIEAPRGLM